MQQRRVALHQFHVPYGKGTAGEHLQVEGREACLYGVLEIQSDCLVHHAVVVVHQRRGDVKEGDVERVGVVDVDGIVTQLERAVEQAALIHQGKVLEKHHRTGRLSVLLRHTEDLLPVVVLGTAYHAHLVDVVTVIVHERPGEDDACYGTQHWNYEL